MQKCHSKRKHRFKRLIIKYPKHFTGINASLVSERDKKIENQPELGVNVVFLPLWSPGAFHYELSSSLWLLFQVNWIEESEESWNQPFLDHLGTQASHLPQKD